MHSLIREIMDSVQRFGMDTARVRWMQRVATVSAEPISARSFAEFGRLTAERSARVAMMADLGRRYLGLS